MSYQGKGLFGASVQMDKLVQWGPGLVSWKIHVSANMNTASPHQILKSSYATKSFYIEIQITKIYII